jgi:hypothetical protein
MEDRFILSSVPNIERLARHPIGLFFLRIPFQGLPPSLSYSVKIAGLLEIIG